jgi:predicted MPP superfamily phosphohydrolase
VLLAHAPLAADLLDEAPGVDLLLAGHTHGGQVRLPLVWRVLVPPYRGRYLAGLYRTAWGHLYVNRGLGGVGPVPLRVRCPPELAVFHISPQGHPA